MIPLHTDNFCYYIYSNENPKEGLLIDVGDESVVNFCIENDIEPLAVLSTHKHWDHTNGNKSMLESFPSIRIFGGTNDNVPHCTDFVSD